MVKYVYLIGSITGMSYRYVTDWRNQLAGYLLPHIKILSPFRDKEFLLSEDSIRGQYPQHFLSSGDSMFARDTSDILRSDAIVANFIGAKEVSRNSLIEVGMSWMRQIPVFLVIDEGNVNDCVFLRRCAQGTTFSDLEDAAEAINSFFPY